jgi:uncharacterized protein
LERRFVWVTSPILMEETRRVLLSDKFELTGREMRTLTYPLFKRAKIINPQISVNVINRCPADNRVLECAVEGNCSFIVSGDRRDLLSLKRYRGIEIIKAREFLSRI